MNRNTAQNSIRLWAVLFWLLIWQGASMAFSALWPNGHLLLASPISAAVRLGELACTAAFWRAVGGSIAHIFGGFLVGCALAVVLAVLSARYRLVRELLAPLTAAVKAVPVVSFIILALVWLDSRSLPLFISALMVSPPVYLNVLAGIAAADGYLPARRPALLPLRRVSGAGPLLEGGRGGGGHRVAIGHHRRAAVHR